MKRMFFVFLIITLIISTAFSLKNTYICGIATGYPPYQFQDAKGQTTGIDADITRLLFKEIGKEVKFRQKPWDTVLGELMFNSGNVDILCGAEISDGRKEKLDFSISYYKREIVLFVLEGSKIKKVEDLQDKIITGDRQSYLEKYINDKKIRVRITQTESKEDSFRKLKIGEVTAVMAPNEVGLYVARQLDIKVSVIKVPYEGSNVAFAVNKGNKELLEVINKALDKLIKTGKIAEVMKKYQ